MFRPSHPLWRPFGSAVAAGDPGPITGAGVRASSSFCPLDPRLQVGLLGVGSAICSAKDFGDEGLSNSSCSLTLGPFLEDLGLWPRPLSCFAPGLSPAPTPQPQAQDAAARAPLAGPGAFALIWPGRSRPPPPPAQPRQACLSHFVFLRFGCGALAGIASNALSG